MRTLGLALAVALLSIASIASCSLKPPFECADGGCWGEPDLGDGGVVAADLATAPDRSQAGD